MALLCPSCNQGLLLPSVPLKEEVDIICQGCNAILKLQLTAILPGAKAAAKPAPLVPINPKKVLVAVEGEVTEEMITEVLSTAGFEAVIAPGSAETVGLMKQHRPIISILDVGLPQVLETIIPEIRAQEELKDLKLILLSCIHNKARYKREPESLYGADDYIERHHIEDLLIEKMDNLITTGKAAPALPKEKRERPVAQASPAERQPEQDAAKVSAEPRKEQAVTGDIAGHDAAKRLARIIISDIALYNQKRVEEGVNKGTFQELLKEELEEGQKLYQSRTPKEVLETTHYFEDAISGFIEKQTARFAK